MKMFLRFLTVFICCLVLIPVLFYSTISIANNCIANNIEDKLISLDLPKSTVLSDSVSIAEKIFGNGNGMQYFGAILITSDLSENELKEYYKQFGEDYFVEKKEDNFVISEKYDHTFSNFPADKNNYMVWCIEYNSHENILYELLDMDFRGK
ncbi:MAG: hypothetical protein IKK26_01735 [Clostridia bacterium]|nr:hypothetical protein [Clostridia bacterium]MBR6651471.1 hypothetical protein [Clostridia bacterium]